MLKKCTSSKEDYWDEFIDTCLFAYNTSKHESTLFSPFELMLGQKAMLPIEVDNLKKDPQDILNNWYQNGTSNASNTDLFNMKHLELGKGKYHSSPSQAKSAV